MGMLDDIKKAAAGQEDAINAAIDQVGEHVDAKTGGQYTEQIDQAEEFVKDKVAEQLNQPQD